MAPQAHDFDPDHHSPFSLRTRDGNELTSIQSFRASDLLLISFAAQEGYRRH